MREAHPPCQVRVRETAAGAVAELHGEIDMLAGPLVSWHLDDLTRTDGCTLIVDLRDVTFLDCAGLATLLRARRRARDLNGRMILVTDAPRMLRTLRLTGALRLFTLYSRIPAALPPASGQSAIASAVPNPE